MGGSGLYLVVDENEQFREDNFLKLQDTFTKQTLGDGKRGGKGGGRGGKGANASGGSDIYKIVKVRSVLLCGVIISDQMRCFSACQLYQVLMNDYDTVWINLFVSTYRRKKIKMENELEVKISLYCYT